MGINTNRSNIYSTLQIQCGPSVAYHNGLVMRFESGCCAFFTREAKLLFFTFDSYP